MVARNIEQRKEDHPGSECTPADEFGTAGDQRIGDHERTGGDGSGNDHTAGRDCENNGDSPIRSERRTANQCRLPERCKDVGHCLDPIDTVFDAYRKHRFGLVRGQLTAHRRQLGTAGASRRFDARVEPE